MSFKVKEFKEESENDNKLIWTSGKVEKLLLAIEEGYATNEHPFYEGDPNYKKGNVVFEYTDWEFDELKKCAKDIVHFANHYCTVMTDEGYMKIILRPYQEKVLRSYQDNRWNIFLAPRQIGKTITSSIFLTWYLLFHFDKNVLLMANKGATTKEIMDKIKAIVEGLPFFLKPGVIKKDVMTMMFDNKCRIIGQNTTKTGGIGFTIHLLFLDEFAHIQESIKRPFYENVYPTLSSSKISRVIITSTPRGYDLFHDLYEGAINGMNEYTPLRVDWWEVPGRNEIWKSREIANLGSEEAFNQQYGCQFLSSSSLLLSSNELLRLKRMEEDYVFHEIDALDDLCIDYSGLRWNPHFDLDQLDNPRNFFLLSNDLSEGIGRDFTVFNIFQIDCISIEDMKKLNSPTEISDFFGIRQIGIFRSNAHDIDESSKILYGLCVNVFDQENLRMVLEYNTYGSHLLKNMVTLYPTSNDFDEEIVVRYFHRIGAKNKNLGLRLQKDNKKLLCEKTKRLVTEGRLLISEKRGVREAELFSRNQNGTFSAQTGHDDIMMTVINSSSFFETLDFSEIVEELYDFVDEDKQGIIEDLLEKQKSDDDLYDIF